MSESKIEWTERTWNPIVGCSILTPGCTNCYAMKMAARLEVMGNTKHYAGTTKKVKGNAVWTGRLALAPDHILLEPLRRKKPTTYFVNSMGDLFHEDCPDEWIDRVLAIAGLCPQHTFQILTKRAERMRVYMQTPDRKRTIAEATMEVSNMMARAARSWKGRPTLDHFSACFAGGGPFKNIWLGVSAERQQEADERIPHLLQTPAAIRFVSAEPLLGPIDLTKVRHKLEGESFEVASVLAGNDGFGLSAARNRLDWIIVGGESRPNARPMHPDWARSLRDQCAAAGVAYFFKQWGQFVPFQGDMERLAAGGGVNYYNPTMKSVGKKAAGRLLDGIEHNAMPERVMA